LQEEKPQHSRAGALKDHATTSYAQNLFNVRELRTLHLYQSTIAEFFATFAFLFFVVLVIVYRRFGASSAHNVSVSVLWQ
jgi:hypothetical protein